MALPLPATDLESLRVRVAALAENRPAVYRMIDHQGRVIYVGKAKKLRPRLLSYFRASYPEDKAARVLYAAADIEWQYVPSEFAAYLQELRQIKRHRPKLNVKLNRTRRVTLVKVLGGSAPKVYTGPGLGPKDLTCYGPFTGQRRLADAVRTLNDLLQLRDCAAAMPMVFAEQGDLFDQSRQAACMRHELGFCAGPCAGLVSEAEYLLRIETARAFLEGRTVQPLDMVVAGMQRAAESRDFELAASWRRKFEDLEWLMAATARARTAVELLTFVYRDPGEFGDDRAYLIRHGTVRAAFPYPATPIEVEAFKAAVREDAVADPGSRPMLPRENIDEVLLLLSWFRRHPEALRRTTTLAEWLE